jgi:hypothetical protein
VFDYGITLKLDDGVLGMKQLVMMLKVHLCMDTTSRGGAYTQSIIMQLMIVLYQKAKNLPTWEMLQGSLSMFNEEAGEITFSQLARAVVGDTQQRKFPHMDRLYKLLHIYGDVELDQLEDTTEAGERSSRRKIDPDGEEVTAVVAYMKQKFREIKTESIMEYDGSKSSYKTRPYAVHHQKPLKARKGYWKDDMLADLKLNIAKSKKKFYQTDWGGQYDAIWPECRIPPGEVGPPGGIVELDSEVDDYQDHVDADPEFEPDASDEEEVLTASDEEQKEHECEDSISADRVTVTAPKARKLKNKEVVSSDTDEE